MDLTGHDKSARAIAISLEPWAREDGGAGLQDQTVVIRFGGAAIEQPHLRDLFAHDVALMWSGGMKPVIVHGGGRELGCLMRPCGKVVDPAGGTVADDDAAMTFVETALRVANGEIVDLLSHHQVRAWGFGGWESIFVQASAREHSATAGEADFGRMGDVASVGPKAIRALHERRAVPVVPSLGIGADGLAYHLNEDVVAGEIAAALGAEMVIYLVDAPGVMAPDGCRYRRLTRWGADCLVDEGALEPALSSAVEGAVRALKGGVGRAYLVDGRVPHALARSFRTRHVHSTEVVL
jgi:acetylglutamate kinase